MHEQRNIRCTEHGLCRCTWRARSQRSRATAWRLSRMPARPQMFRRWLLVLTSLCAMGISGTQSTCTRRSRSRLSCIQYTNANAVRGDTCRAQAMQLLAQRGKLVCNGAGDSRAWGGRYDRQLLRTGRRSDEQQPTREQQAGLRGFAIASSAFTHSFHTCPTRADMY